MTPELERERVHLMNRNNAVAATVILFAAFSVTLTHAIEFISQYGDSFESSEFWRSPFYVFVFLSLLIVPPIVQKYQWRLFFAILIVWSAFPISMAFAESLD